MAGEPEEGFAMPAAARTRRRWKAGAVQMTSTDDVDRNVARAVELVAEASREGARFVALPENFAYLRAEGMPVRYREPLDGELVRRMGVEAKRHRIWLLLGSIPEAVPRSRRIHNTSVLLGPDGRVAAVYRKMHLFDIDVPGKVVLRESRTVVAGPRPVVANTPLGRIGLSICYDLRFPELYRNLTLAGAEVLLVPSAFTAFTGPHHWLPLLRARAIENIAYVVAAAQWGAHAPGRASHGHALIVDPWGSVLAQVPDGEGVAVAELDFDRQDRLRRELPALSHIRLPIG